MSLSLKNKQEINGKHKAFGEGVIDAGENFNSLTYGHTLSPARITNLLLFVALMLLISHLLVVHLGYEILSLFRGTTRFPLYQEIYYSLYNQFHLGLEGNMATYFSAFNLAVASALLYLIYISGKEETFHWLYLSIFFLFLSIDESAQIHEIFGGIAGNQFNLYLKEVPPFLSWAWMVPYAVLVIVVVLYFFKFTLKLPKQTRSLFYLSGFVYVFAALGLEFFEAHFDTVYGPENLMNQFLYPCEEVLEMFGIIIFIYSLLDYLKMKNKVLQLSFANSK